MIFSFFPAFFLALIAAFAMRLLIVRRRLGADHWYWRMWVRSFRSQKRFPPVLSQYVLDEHQWYPPLFPLMLSVLPKRVLDSYDWVVPLFMDGLRLFLLCLVAAQVSNGSTIAILSAGLLYGFTPIAMTVNSQINPRIAGALLLDVAAWLFLFSPHEPAMPWSMVAIISLMTAILLTHKMSAQLMVFCCVSAAFMMRSPACLYLIPSAAVAAFVVSGGYYGKVLRAHGDIIAFWNRNWKWLSSHPVKDSPLYGTSKQGGSTKLHQRGFAGVVSHAKTLFGLAPVAWLAWPLVMFYVWHHDANPVVVHTCAWLLAIEVFVVITTFIPFMKCLGAGYYYLLNAAFPAVVLSSFVCAQLDPYASATIVAFIILLCSISIRRYLHNAKVRRTTIDREGFGKSIAFLRTAAHGAVMCLPHSWSDAVAYLTDKPVLWGGHGYGFSRLQPTYPILLEPIEAIVSRYGIRFLLTSRDYLPETFIARLPAEEVVTFGDVCIYCLTLSQNSRRM